MDYVMRDLLKRNLEMFPGTESLEFINAAFGGDIRRLTEWLLSCKDAHNKERLAEMAFAGIGALQMSALSGALDTVKLFVEDFKFPIDSISGDLELTALYCSVVSGHLDTVKYLLEKKADPNKLNIYGHSPLHIAARYGRDQIAQLLIEKGAIVDEHEYCSTGSPLHIAAFFGKTEVMEVLLEKGAYVELVSDVGTPLTATLYATAEVLKESTALECVKLLVKARAKVEYTFPDNPLAIATTHGLYSCIDYLLVSGANANTRHEICCNALPIELAAQSGKTKNVHLLLSYTTKDEKIKQWDVNGICLDVRSRHRKLPKHKASRGMLREINSKFYFVRMADLPRPDINIVVKDNDADPFQYIEKELRDVLATHPHQCDLLEDLHPSDSLHRLGPHPLLEGQTNEDPPTRWVCVKIQVYGTMDSIMLIIRADNVYVKGFCNWRDKITYCYELAEPDMQLNIGKRPAVLPLEFLPQPLDWDVKYKELLNCQNDDLEEKFRAMDEDPRFVSEAIKFLSCFDPTLSSDHSEAMERIAGITFKLCEYSRLKLRQRNRPFMGDVQSWREMSTKLNVWKENRYHDDKFDEKKTLKETIGVECPGHALERLYLVLNRSLDHVVQQEKGGKKSKKISAKGNRNKYAYTSGQGGDSDKGPKEDNKKNAYTSGRGGEPFKGGGKSVPLGRHRVQLLKVTANFPVGRINMYDSQRGQTIYHMSCSDKVVCNSHDAEGLVLRGPRRPLDASGFLQVEAFPHPKLPGCPILGQWDPYIRDEDEDEDEDEGYPLLGRWGPYMRWGPYIRDEYEDEGYPILGRWDPYIRYEDEDEDVDEDEDEPLICVQSIGGGFGRVIEMTYLVIPNAIEVEFMVLLCPVAGAAESVWLSGSIIACSDVVTKRRGKTPRKRACSAGDFKGHHVTIFDSKEPHFCAAANPLGCPLPLSPSSVCLPYRPQFALTVEVNLRIQCGEAVSNMVCDMRFTPSTGLLCKVTHGHKLHVFVSTSPDLTRHV